MVKNCWSIIMLVIAVTATDERCLQMAFFVFLTTTFIAAGFPCQSEE